VTAISHHGRASGSFPVPASRKELAVMNVTETTRRFLGFFAHRGHQLLQGSSLVPPDGDPVLFTTAGMHPLTGYLEGRPHPKGRRLTGVQRCLRTSDLDEVGDSYHLTVFKMLGSWSLGDYEGPQSQRFGLELLTDGFGLNPALMHATVFGGDEQVGPDTGAERTWLDLGLPVERLTQDNWWSNGPTGPCGPDSEIFVWTGDGPPSGTPGTDERWLELWNHVTMRYDRQEDGSLRPLRQCSVDTGMGLERLMMVSQNQGSVFGTDLFEPWLRVLPKLWSPSERQVRLLTDHLRSAIVVVGDGVRPASTGRGYVLRRLVRRALTELWRSDTTRSLDDLPLPLIQHTLDHFGQRSEGGKARDVLLAEQRKFRDLVTRGRSVLARLYPAGSLTEADYQYLHETHGLPRELVTDLLS
jgi:alanyl-tRNA synthetase